MRGMIQLLNRKPPTIRWYREKYSRPCDETPVSFFIICNPLSNFLFAEFTWRRQLGSRCTQSGGEKQDKFLFLTGRQFVCGSLDFSKCAHAGGIKHALLAVASRLRRSAIRDKTRMSQVSRVGTASSLYQIFHG